MLALQTTFCGFYVYFCDKQKKVNHAVTAPTISSTPFSVNSFKGISIQFFLNSFEICSLVDFFYSLHNSYFEIINLIALVY